MQLKKKLEKRLAYLYSGELVSSILFIPASYWLNFAFPKLKLFTLFSFWTSFILLELLLLQGVIYWGSKLKRLRSNETTVTPLQSINRFILFKRINMIILGVGILAFGIDLVRWNLDSAFPTVGLLLTLGIYVFAFLEFINYFYIQLSYDSMADLKYLIRNRRLKCSFINKEIKRSLKGVGKK